jgi:hypothetical protein
MNKPENNGFVQQIHQNYKTQGTDGIKPIPKKKREKKTRFYIVTVETATHHYAALAHL